MRSHRIGPRSGKDLEMKFCKVCKVIELVRLLSQTQKGSYGKVCIAIKLFCVVSRSHKRRFGKVPVDTELFCIVSQTQKGRYGKVCIYIIIDRVSVSLSVTLFNFSPIFAFLACVCISYVSSTWLSELFRILPFYRIFQVFLFFRFTPEGRAGRQSQLKCK